MIRKNSFKLIFILTCLLTCSGHSQAQSLDRNTHLSNFFKARGIPESSATVELSIGDAAALIAGSINSDCYNLNYSISRWNARDTLFRKTVCTIEIDSPTKGFARLKITNGFGKIKKYREIPQITSEKLYTFKLSDLEPVLDIDFHYRNTHLLLSCRNDSICFKSSANDADENRSFVSLNLNLSQSDIIRFAVAYTWLIDAELAKSISESCVRNFAGDSIELDPLHQVLGASVQNYCRYAQQVFF